jgi:hypothetical protein
MAGAEAVANRLRNVFRQLARGGGCADTWQRAERLIRGPMLIDAHLGSS